MSLCPRVWPLPLDQRIPPHSSETLSLQRPSPGCSPLPSRPGGPGGRRTAGTPALPASHSCLSWVFRVTQSSDCPCGWVEARVSLLRPQAPGLGVIPRQPPRWGERLPGPPGPPSTAPPPPSSRWLQVGVGKCPTAPRGRGPPGRPPPSQTCCLWRAWVCGPCRSFSEEPQPLWVCNQVIPWLPSLERVTGSA